MATARFKQSTSPVILEMSAEEAVVVWSLTGATADVSSVDSINVYSALDKLLRDSHNQRKITSGTITLKGAN